MKHESPYKDKEKIKQRMNIKKNKKSKRKKLF